MSALAQRRADHRKGSTAVADPPRGPRVAPPRGEGAPVRFFIYPLTVAAKAPEAETRTAAQRLAADATEQRRARVGSRARVDGAHPRRPRGSRRGTRDSRRRAGCTLARTTRWRCSRRSRRCTHSSTAARPPRASGGLRGSTAASCARRGGTCAYEEGGGKGRLGAAWDVYYACYRRMAKHLSRLNRSSSRTSRRSCWTRRTSSCPSRHLPGGRPPTTIRSFSRQLSVIASKQRPRKLRRARLRRRRAHAFSRGTRTSARTSA